jgi:hypothetical protein
VIKIALLDQICSLKLDVSILDAIRDCTKCKNFGPTHIHSLFEPITRWHPFELLVGDYLLLPKGKNGYNTIGVYVKVILKGNGSKGLRPQLIRCAPFPSIAPYFRMLYVLYPKIQMAVVAYLKVRKTIVWYPGIEESNVFLSEDKE